MPPTTLADLVQAGLEGADCEKSNNFSPDELNRYANESLSETYDEIVLAWEEYFQESAAFTLGDSGALGLRQITTGVAPPPAFPVASPSVGGRVVLSPPGPVFSSTVGTSTAKQFFDVGGTTSFPAPRNTFKPPPGRILQLNFLIGTAVPTGGASVAIYKNGLPTEIAFFISGGASGSQNFDETNWTAPVSFNGSDTMDLCITETTSHSTWTFSSETIYQLDQPSSLFYKEAGLVKVGCSDPILPLDTYANRNSVAGPRYWIAGDTISIWPQFPGATSHAGDYVLDYVPNCPIMVLGDVLPFELERWKELISVGIAIKCKTKRDQDTASLERRQLKLIEGITKSKGARKKEVRRMQPMRQWDQFPRWPWSGKGRPFGW